MANKLRIKLVRSPIGHSVRQKRTVKALGLRKMSQEVIRPDNAAIRGMLGKVEHLVEFEEIETPEA